MQKQVSHCSAHSVRPSMFAFSFDVAYVLGPPIKPDSIGNKSQKQLSQWALRQMNALAEVSAQSPCRTPAQARGHARLAQGQVHWSRLRAPLLPVPSPSRLRLLLCLQACLCHFCSHSCSRVEWGFLSSLNFLTLSKPFLCSDTSPALSAFAGGWEPEQRGCRLCRSSCLPTTHRQASKGT